MTHSEPTTDKPERVYLYCDHCGCEAVESDADLLFSEDMGDGKCMTCGFPGSVTVDEDYGAAWYIVDEVESKCNDPKCEECRSIEAFPPESEV